MDAYIGTYTNGGGEGIYRIRLGPGSGEARLAARAENPSYLTPGSGSGAMLYAVLETAETEGAVCAFSVEADGSLLQRAAQATGGRHPCHLCVHGGRLYAANYSSGSLAVFPLKNGLPGPALQILRHEGAGPHPTRQEGPHAHCIVPVPGGDMLCVADLGLDRLRFSRPCAEGLALAEELAVNPGAGPRHIVFSGDGRLAWLVCELSNEVYALRRERSWAVTGIYPTLPEGYAGESTCAAIRLSPDGALLCASNRGHDSVACFRVDAASGALTPAGIFPTGGKTPRDIAFSPDGSLLLAANQDSGTVTALSVAEGFRQAAALEIPSPVCILPIPAN